jgi:poly-gamma-glutamate synthesis protein (capsule biosynthesis protein)
MPAVLGDATRRVAFVAVTTSAPPAARATDPTSTLEGRAGVSPLRYRVEITVDAETFRVLRESVAGPSSGESEIVVGDARLRTGDRATVDVAVDRADEDAVLASIAAARAAAEVVIVSLHSHEPSNGHEEPPDFVRQFARAAIERGASLVVGHGPHGLRGVELHGDGAILYSLGNFVYRARGLADVPADTYDAGTNLFEAALSGVRSDAPGTLALDEAGWWQGVVARAVISQGRLESLTLVPVDLGVGRPLEDRGWPRPADAGLTAEILERIDSLSRAFGTRVDVRSGSAAVSLNVRQ